MAPAAPLLVAAFLAVLGLFVLLAQPSRRLNQLFAALFLLRAASTASFSILREVGDASDALMYARLSVWYALLTPLLLVAIAGHLFLAPGMPRRVVVGGAAAATFVFALAHALVPGALVAGVGPGARGGFRYDSTLAFDAFAGATTLLEAGIVLLAARACRSPHEAALSRRQAALLGVAFAFVPVRAGLLHLSILLASPESLAAGAAALRILPGLAALVLIAAAIPSLLRGLEGGMLRVALLLLPAFAALGVLDGLGAVLGASFVPGYDTGSSLARAAFAATASLALLRYGLAGASPDARRRFETVARGALALSLALLAAGIALALLGLTTAGLVAAPFLGVAALLLSPVPLRALAPRILRRVLLPPDHPLGDAGRLPRAGDATPPAPPPLLGRYRLERELGRGASGSAHLATDLLAGGVVVLKRFHAPSSRAAVTEARALAAMRHPRVVPLLDVERVGAETFLVLGHVPGGTAREALDRDGPLPPPAALRLALDVLDALDALHARGIVHGDVKAENVLLDAEGRAILGDLGSSRFVSVDVTLTGDLGAGSLSAIAPEVLRGERASPSSDLYATAALLHRLLTGRHYVDLEGVDAFAARERILLDPPRLPDPRVPPSVEEVLRQALAKRPTERPPDARAFAHALREASRLLVDEHGAPHPDHVARP